MSYTHRYRVLDPRSTTHLCLVLNVHITCLGSPLPYYLLGEYRCRIGTVWNIEIPICGQKLPLPCCTLDQVGRPHTNPFEQLSFIRLYTWKHLHLAYVVSRCSLILGNLTWRLSSSGCSSWKWKWLGSSTVIGVCKWGIESTFCVVQFF